MKLAKIKIHMAPRAGTKHCYNCAQFSLWGVQYGYCTKHEKDKSSHEGKYCKSFKIKEV